MPSHDLDFRPASYWDPADPVSAILGNITGENRRRMVREFITGQAPEVLGEIDARYLADAVDPDTRNSLGGLHPSWMGGEYLPAYLPGEVEIARIVLRSVTQDVISVRARRRRGGRRIFYRVVDEYQGEFGLTWAVKSSCRPLALRDLIRLIDSIRMADDAGRRGTYLDLIRDTNVDAGADPEEMADFASVESEIYPGIRTHYDQQAAAWLAAATSNP